MKLCRLHRILASLWLDKPEHLPFFIQSHVRECPTCRERLGRESDLVRELRAASRAGREPLPAFLPSRIQSGLQSIELRGETPVTPMALPRRLVWVGGAVAVVLCSGMIFMRWTEPMQTITVATRPVAWSPVLRLPGGSSWEQWGQRLEQPLNREIASALEDGRGALLALVEDFVPEPHVADVTERTKGLFPEWPAPATVQP